MGRGSARLGDGPPQSWTTSSLLPPAGRSETEAPRARPLDQCRSLSMGSAMVTASGTESVGTSARSCSVGPRSPVNARCRASTQAASIQAPMCRPLRQDSFTCVRLADPADASIPSYTVANFTRPASSRFNHGIFLPTSNVIGLRTLRLGRSMRSSIQSGQTSAAPLAGGLESREFLLGSYVGICLRRIVGSHRCTNCA